MLDLAMFVLAADMMEKAGAEGVRDYWTRVGATYAKRIGTETFVGWPQFNIATNERRTSLTVLGEVRVLTDMALNDKEGNIIGYVYAIRECPMVACYDRWMGIMGQAIHPVDQQVVQHYNQTIRPSAVSSFCVLCQMFHEEAARALTVGESQLDCLTLAARSRMGVQAVLKPALEVLGLEEKYIVSLLREQMCIYALIEQGKIDISSYPRAGTIKLGKQE